MINPLPYLPLLNTSLPSPSLTSSLYCFHQTPPNETLLPLIYKECQQVIPKIPLGDKALAPVIFSRSETAGFTVPRTWGEGSCVVAIDVDGDGVEETSTFRAITERAWALMLACVIMEPHLGGRTRLGEHEMMSVLVYNPVEAVPVGE